jgi:endoglucanase
MRLSVACVGCGLAITPAEMQAKMGMGINLGNTLEAPQEGQWAPAAKEYYFDAYKQQGFKNVRVPVRWDAHTSQSAPYTIDATWMARVEEVVGWSLARGFPTTMNVHHDDWLDDPNAFDGKLPRFVAIWEQVAEHFKGKEDNLVFECFNEPHQMTADQLNRLNAACVSTIRKSNPDRIIMISGLSWDSPQWIMSGQLQIPEDKQLMVHVHSYDPWAYCSTSPTQHSWGSAADRAALADWIGQMDAWSKKYNLPVYYGEFGVTHAQTPSTGRVVWYQARQQAIAKVGWAGAVWDDCGDLKVYDRASNSWDQAVADALTGKGPSCPGEASCGCDWTQGGANCGLDDGSECFCRCCCPYSGSGFQCKWQPGFLATV